MSKDLINGVSIEKLNELFANALALELLGRTSFLNLLARGGITGKKAIDLTNEYEKFLNDYSEKLGVIKK